MTRLALAALACCALGMAACGDESDDGGSGASGDSGRQYSEQARRDFMSGCTNESDATEEQCRCSLEKIEERWSEAEFERIGEALNRDESPPEEKELEELAESCADA